MKKCGEKAKKKSVCFSTLISFNLKGDLCHFSFQEEFLRNNLFVIYNFMEYLKFRKYILL